mgnify:CR=1 FL=1
MEVVDKITKAYNKEPATSININIELDNMSVRIPYNPSNEYPQYANMVLTIYGNNITDEETLLNMISTHWKCQIDEDDKDDDEYAIVFSLL